MFIWLRYGSCLRTIPLQISVNNYNFLCVTIKQKNTKNLSGRQQSSLLIIPRIYLTSFNFSFEKYLYIAAPMVDTIALRIKLGDEQAFELLFRKFYVRLCAFSNKFLNDPQEAQEISQEVFIRIWEGRDDINPEDSLKSYIFMITQNLSINRLRKRKVESRYAEIYKLIYLENREFSVFESLIASELEEKYCTCR
jgi:hypothetical protein